MNPPVMKKELVIQRCPAPQVISAVIGTAKALKWIKGASCYFTHMSRLMTCEDETPTLPCEVTLGVCELYDFDEVYAYLKSAPFLQEKCNTKKG